MLLNGRFKENEGISLVVSSGSVRALSTYPICTLAVAKKNAGLTRHFYLVFKVIRSWMPCVAAVPASEYALVAARSVHGVSQLRNR